MQLIILIVVLGMILAAAYAAFLRRRSRTEKPRITQAQLELLHAQDPGGYQRPIRLSRETVRAKRES